MSNHFIKELQELVNATIITKDKAQEITDYYLQKNKEKPNRFSAVVNILGALLAAIGMLLVIAHNWDELGRTAKTLLSFLPLAIGQVLCAYTLIKQKHNVAWMESSAIILFFAVASSISLISQTYHIGGTMSDFLLTWMLLTIPLVYILPSSVTALLYIAGITWYACNMGYFNYTSNSIPYYYLLLLALIIPHYYAYYKNNRQSNFFLLLNWVLLLSVIIVLGSFGSNVFDRTEWVFTGYMALFCVFYLLGRSTVFENNKLFANPFLVTGSLGILFILMFWSFNGSWEDAYGYSDSNSPSLFLSPFLYLTIALLLFEGWLILTDYRRVKKIIFDPIAFSGFVLFVFVILFRNTPLTGTLLINIWVLFVAVFFIRKGALQNHFGILNFGLLIIAMLAAFRFFDEQIPFIWRGLFFIATGAGFFIANYWLVKKRKVIYKK